MGRSARRGLPLESTLCDFVRLCDRPPGGDLVVLAIFDVGDSPGAPGDDALESVEHRDRLGVGFRRDTVVVVGLDYLEVARVLEQVCLLKFGPSGTVGDYVAAILVGGNHHELGMQCFESAQ